MKKVTIKLTQQQRNYIEMRCKVVGYNNPVVPSVLTNFIANIIAQEAIDNFPCEVVE